MANATSSAREFGERYFAWAKLQLANEYREDFPVLRASLSKAAHATLWYLTQLPPAAVEPLLDAMLRRFHQHSGGHLVVPLTQKDRDVLAAMGSAVIPYQLYRLGPRGKGRPSPRRVKAALLSHLARLPPAGELIPNWGPGFIVHRTSVHRWPVYTMAFYRKPYSYWHWIGPNEDRIADIVSLCSWLGVTSVTDSDMASAGDEDLIADTIARNAQRFLEALPGLLDGLRPAA